MFRESRAFKSYLGGERESLVAKVTRLLSRAGGNDVILREPTRPKDLFDGQARFFAALRMTLRGV